MHNERWNDGMGGGSAWWMAVMMLAFLAVVAAAIILLWRRNDDRSRLADVVQALPQQSPQAILAERLARGEIEPEEYSTRLSALLVAPPS